MNAAVLARAVAQAPLVRRERRDLGAHSEILVETFFFADGRGEIGHPRKLFLIHPRSVVPDRELGGALNVADEEFGLSVVRRISGRFKSIFEQLADHHDFGTAFDRAGDQKVLVIDANGRKQTSRFQDENGGQRTFSKG